MPISLRQATASIAGLLVPAALVLVLGFAAPFAHAQSDTPPPPTALEKLVEHFDLGLQAAATLTNTADGTQQRDHIPMSIRSSTTVGELGTLRFTAKPWVAFEFNFGNSRSTQNFIFPTLTNNLIPGGVQANVHEFTWAYVAKPPHKLFGVIQPFGGIGGGFMHFRPTPGGGQSLPRQFRQTYFYEAGLEGNFPNSHFGMRTSFRQLIYLAPDFGQNYLTVTRRVRTSEPTVGFFVRF